jgi:hypothetical protein
MHFAPQDGVYVYFRYTENNTVMVILNKNTEQKAIDTSRFKEVISDYTSGNEIISGKQLADISKITVPARQAMIIELDR